jgi:hypothetical protein
MIGASRVHTDTRRRVHKRYDALVQGRCDGKPVKVRRGPATVFGDASRMQPLARTTRREGAAGRPVSQETKPDVSQYALVERGGPVKKVGIVLSSTLVLACGVLVPVALGASAGPAVKVEIKTLTKTLLPPTTEHGQTGWITKGGAPSGKCSGDSGAGALNAATHGKWTAKYYASLHDVFIESILGVKPPGKDFWEILVNGKTASTGACGVKLHAGELIEFKIAKS